MVKWRVNLLIPQTQMTLSSPIPCQAALSATDMALALNRYLCTAVLPLLTRCAPLFAGTEHHASLIDSLLHTVYRLSKGCSLTKAQRDSIEVCLLSICGWVGITVTKSLLLSEREFIYHVALCELLGILETTSVPKD